MRQIIAIIISFFSQCALGQNEEPKEITPQELQRLKNEVENDIPEFKENISKQGFNKDQTEFAIDTFRIECLVSKCMDIDYSTVGMNSAIIEMTSSYDKLMNKYYNKLLKSLSIKDRQILKHAQKSWLAFIDSESNLIGVMTQEEYSGGGTIQSTIAVSVYAELVKRRAVDIFLYYDNILKDS